MLGAAYVFLHISFLFFWSLIEGSPSHSFERSEGEGKKHDEEKGFACNWLEQPFRPPSHFFFPFVQCAEP